MRALSIPRYLVHVLEVATEVTTLSEGLLAHRTVERSLACVLSEVISQVAALLEDALACGMLAFEIELDALSDIVFDLNGLVPFLRDALKGARFNTSDYRVVTEL